MTTSKTTTPDRGSPRVYSYIRFSTPEQSLGDSERRQLEGARGFAAKIKLPFDESLRMTDRGLSGYHGTHRKKGALGAFLARVEAGDVPAGSILVVENVDRLSREGFLDAFEVIRNLLRKGISIHTLSPEATYDRQSLNTYAIYQLVGQMMLAHEESEKKAERSKAVWIQKRKRLADGVMLTQQAPAWLRVKDSRFEVIPAAAKAVQAIFNMKLEGLGKDAIAGKLNSEGYWTPPYNKKRLTAGWRASYIEAILVNRQVIGEFQPCHLVDEKRVPDGEPIRDYYPAVVKPGIFHKVQQRLAANRGGGGRTGKASNLFSGLCFCGYCGGPMHFVNKGTSPKGRCYIICYNGRRKVKCRSHAVRYDELETTILDNCRRLQPERVLPNPDAQTAKIEALRQQQSNIEAQLQDIETRTANLVDQIERTPIPQARARYEARMTALDAQKAQLTADRQTVQAELTSAESASTSFTKWKRTLAELRQALASGDVDARLRMRMHLRELIDRVEVWAAGFTRAYNVHASRESNRDAEHIGERFDDLAYEFKFKLPRGFTTWATKQAMSKRGRFLRLHFKSGEMLRVVPKGSIGSGLAVAESGWKIIQPDLEALVEEFKRGKP